MSVLLGDLEDILQPLAPLARIELLVHSLNVVVEKPRELSDILLSKLGVTFDELVIAALRAASESQNVPALRKTNSLIEAAQKRGFTVDTPPIDENVLVEMGEAAALKLSRMEKNLQRARESRVFHSMQNAVDECFEYLCQIGRFSDAAQLLMDSETALDTAQEFALHARFLEVHLISGNYSGVPDLLAKTDSPKNRDGKIDNMSRGGPKRDAVIGLLRFSKGDFGGMDNLIRSLSKMNVNERFDSMVISTVDMTLYIALAALSSPAKWKVLQNEALKYPAFTQALATVHEARDLLHNFEECEFPRCLEIMKSIEPLLLLDTRLSHVLPALMEGMRKHIVIRLWKSFDSLRLEFLQELFACTLSEAKAVVASCLRDKSIPEAKFDAVDNILYRVSTCEEYTTEALILSNLYERQARCLKLQQAQKRSAADCISHMGRA